MNEPRVYVHGAAALGPGGDTAPAERRKWQSDPPPFDCRDLVKRVIGAPLRQASHLVELATVGSRLCLERLSEPASPSTAIYAGTGLAEVRKTHALFLQVMTPGAGMASPFDFINSANNMAAFYTAKMAGFRARNLTITQEEFSFEWALKLAINDLRDHRIDAALVGGFDENSQPRGYHMRRFALDDSQIMGEGGGWLYLSRSPGGATGEILLIDGPSPDSANAGRIAKLVDNLRHGDEPVLLLPGFRLVDQDIAALRNPFRNPEVYRYIEFCGCFHTAAAFGIASVFDETPRRSRLLVHANRQQSGHGMVVVIRQFATSPAHGPN